MILLIILLVFLLVYLVFSVTQFYNIIFRGYAPFISTDAKTFREIIKAINFKEDISIYELGCGRARFLRIIENKFSKKFFGLKLVGVENLSSIYCLTKFWRSLQGSRIKLIKADIFSLNLREANIIYCYLNNSTMERLGVKFNNECKKGTQIISRRFPIKEFVAEKVLEISGIKVYFYLI